MSDETTPAIERAATAYLHMVPHCAGCVKESKGLLRRCGTCKDLAIEFAFHMLGDALDLDEMTKAFVAPTPWDDLSDRVKDEYRLRMRHVRKAILGSD